MRSRWFALACGLVVACSQAKTHAPFLADDASGFGGFTHPSAGGPPVDGGSGTPVGGHGTGTLAGEVSVFRDLEFVNIDPFLGNGLIVVRGIHSVQGTLSGSNFSVDQTDVSKNLWVSIEQTLDGGFGALMPTITLVDGTASDVSVAFVKTSVMTEIAQLISPIPPALTAPALDTRAAQIFIRFVDPAGSPLTNIQLSLPTNVLYDSPSGRTYTDLPAPAHTNSLGIAIVVNLPTSFPFPGAKTQLLYKTPTSATALAFDAYVAQGAVTIMTVVVPS